MKKPDLNKPVFKIFSKKEVIEGKCPMCSKEIKETEFKDKLSKKEYSISGLCQKCQDDIFNK